MNRTCLLIIAGIFLLAAVVAIILGSCSKNESESVFDKKVISPYLQKDSDKILFYAEGDKKFYKIENENAPVELNFDLSLAGKEEIESVEWSPTEEKAIIKIGSQETELIKTWFYDFTNGNNNQLNENILAVKWSPDGSKIYYVYQSTTKNQLEKSNPDGSAEEIILDLSSAGVDEPLFSVSPNEKEIALYDTSSATPETNIVIFETESKNIKKITSEGYSLKPKWSPDGAKIFFERLDQSFMPSLWVMNKDGSDAKDLGVETFAEKAIWGNNSVIIAAIPKEIPSDYLGQNIDYQDSLKAIYLDGNVKSIEATGGTEIGNLMISKDSKKLFFTINDLLYKLGIKI